jgi:hypothetical protein
MSLIALEHERQRFAADMNERAALVVFGGFIQGRVDRRDRDIVSV